MKQVVCNGVMVFGWRHLIAAFLWVSMGLVLVVECVEGRAGHLQCTVVSSVNLTAAAVSEAGAACWLVLAMNV